MKIIKLIKTASFAVLAVMAVSCVEENDLRLKKEIMVDVSTEGPMQTKSGISTETESVDLSFDDLKITLTATAAPVTDEQFGSYDTKAAAVNSSGDISSFNMKISAFSDVATVEKNANNAWALIRSEGQHYLWPEDIPAGGLCFDSYYGSGAAINGNTVSYTMTDSDLLIGRTFATKNNVPVHLYHPLASLRFKINHAFLEGFTVTDIKLSNIYTTGQFTLPSTGTVDQAVDLFSFNWTGLASPQTVSPDVYSSAADEFFIIPQSTSGVKMTITFHKGEDGTNKVLEIDMPDAGLADGCWQAGYFYTYTISGGGFVDIEAADKMDGVSTSTTGATKTDVKADNLGSLPVYVRAYVLTNWRNAAHKIVAQYTGAINFNTTDWKLGSDGFYYHKGPVAVDASSANLIDSFTPDTATAPSHTGMALHAEMQVIFQAVEVGSASQVWPNTSDYMIE